MMSTEPKKNPRAISAVSIARWTPGGQGTIMMIFYGFLVTCLVIVALVLLFLYDPTIKKKAAPKVPITNGTTLMTAVDSFVKTQGSNANTTKFGPLISEWNVTGVANFSHLFSAKRNPMMSNFSFNVSTWNTSNATNMASMFLGCTSFNGNLSRWNVSKVADMHSMFDGATNFSGIGLEKWNTKSLKNLTGTFSGAVNFNAFLGNWSVGGVTSMKKTFWNADMFTGAGIESWNTSNVTDMRYMFANTTAFNGSLATWNVANVKKFDAMFYGAAGFKGLSIINWVIPANASILSMLCEATGVSPLFTTSWTSTATTCQSGFVFESAFDHFNASL